MTQPQSGWKQGRMGDMAKGFGKGVGGVILKPQAGRYIAYTNESLVTDTRQKVYGDSSDIR